MTRVTSSAEHNVFTDPPRIVNAAAGTDTEVFASEQNANTGEISKRFIQNTGANECYYSEGIDQCNALNYHGKIAAGQQLDCSDHRQSVRVNSAAGTTIATTIRRRRE